MKTILIGDVGATGSDWALSSQEGFRQFSLSGYNPVSQSASILDQLLLDLRNEIHGTRLQELHFYGAGIGVTAQTEKVKNRIVEILKLSRVFLYSDLLGAARALCGSDPGVVCILGTGSNACYYDGTAILNGHSLGYPLGDEGSGMDIGKRVVKSYYYGLMPDQLKRHFSQVLPSSRLDFLNIFRQESAPNRYLASLSSMLQNIQDEPFIQELLTLAFTDFIICHLGQIKRYSKINAIGSIAYYFCGEFEKCLKEHQLSLGKVIQRPLDDLVVFHTQNLQTYG